MSPTTAIAPSTGTPLWSIVPSVRAKRAVSTFKASGPTIGSRSTTWSQLAGHGQRGADRPVTLQGRADRHEDLRRQRDGLAEIVEDGGEARDDERHQEDDGGGADG